MLSVWPILVYSKQALPSSITPDFSSLSSHLASVALILLQAFGVAYEA